MLVSALADEAVDSLLALRRSYITELAGMRAKVIAEILAVRVEVATRVDLGDGQRTEGRAGAALRRFASLDNRAFKIASEIGG